MANRPTALRVVSAIAAAISFIAPYTMEREGRPHAVYRDQGGVLTGGYGHTGSDVPKLGTPVSETLARAWLARDLNAAGAGVGRCVDPKVLLAQPTSRLGVLTDFAYNVGAPAFCRSTLVKRLNAGDTAGACAEMSKWVYVTVDGRKVKSPGLVNARAQQRAICEEQL